MTGATTASALRAPAERKSPALAWLLTVGGTFGLIAAVALLVEKIRLIQDPTYVPTCSISPLLSCGSIMNSAQAEVFGFPNPILGVAGFPVVATVGIALLAGATFRRWFWLGLQVGTTFGAVFVHWLIFQSLYRIQALCPYCMAVWAVTIPLFWYVSLHNLRAGHLRLPTTTGRRAAVLIEYHGVVLTAWFLAIVAAITAQFWTYWSSLVG